MLIALSGFLFIFAPGVPMGLLRRFGRSFPRELLYWGMGIWMVALIPTYFLQSLVRQAVQGGGSIITAFQAEPATYALSLVNALLAALLLAVGMAIYLRRKRLPEAERDEGGLTMGFGVGLIAQVFTGLSLVGAGFRLAYGDTGDPGLRQLANSPMLDLLVGLLAMVLFRVALLTVSGVVGILIARSVGGSRRFFWLAAGIYAGFSWLIVAAQLAIGGENPGAILAGQASLLTSAVTVVYYLAAIALAYAWLQRRLTDDTLATAPSARPSRRGRRQT
ncbi:MAG: hypothetical protein A2Z66_07440 [Chloroflexi bacterium RBG_13_66_10]|nr:MAG: hypothetical protein A2Z66_07440 [Chloroflexi bacterium RBG_13_66_10]